MLRIFFIILLTIHALLHILGFVKGLELSTVKQLTQTISKSAGLIWLLAAILLILTGVLFAFKNSYWWRPGLIAVITSQLLIIYYWQDAKYGTLANVIVLIVCIFGYASWSYYKNYQREVRAGLQQKEYFEGAVITAKDIAHLPNPVKKYLQYTGCIGKPKVNNFKIEFTGKIRKDEHSDWMPFTSEQYNFLETPTRLFFMEAEMKHLPVAGYHYYANGNASMDIRLLSLFTVQFQDGDEMNKAETVTFFNDMCCLAPATLIDKRISWQAMGDNSAKATFTINGITITAELFFNEVGELINFKSDDRYNSAAGKKQPWATPLKDYKEMNGYKLAGSAETIYTNPEKDFCYGTFEVKSIHYNLHYLH